MTTRILESRCERLLIILLLALAVPCSAQLGVVMGMLASISLIATLIWAGVVASILLVVGWLGLSPEASAAFLLGFLRRDFAATGLMASCRDVCCVSCSGCWSQWYRSSIPSWRSRPRSRRR